MGFAKGNPFAVFRRVLRSDSSVEGNLGFHSEEQSAIAFCSFYPFAQSMGYRVPQDISMIGMDDVETAEYFRPALTTIHIPFKKMGIVAVDNLLQLITDPDITCLKTVINHRRVERESCRDCGITIVKT